MSTSLAKYNWGEIANGGIYLARECMHVLADFLRTNPKARHALKGMAGGMTAGALVGSLLGPGGMVLGATAGALGGALVGEEIGGRLERSARAILHVSDAMKQVGFTRICAPVTSHAKRNYVTDYLSGYFRCLRRGAHYAVSLQYKSQ